MAWIAPVVGAASSLLGDLFSQSGQQQTNAMNMAMMMQNEQWQTQMSNTAMQRRVADLQAAGLNPLLATGTQGAAMPSFQQPMLQNPNQAFGQMGEQMTSAMQAAQIGPQIAQTTQQTDTLKAQAEKSRAEAAYTAGPGSNLAGAQADAAKAQASYTDFMRTNLGPAQEAAARAAGQLDTSQKARIDQQINSGDIAATVKQIQASTRLEDAQAGLAKIDTIMDHMTAIEKQYAMPFVISLAGTNASLAKMELNQAQATSNYFNTWAGQHLMLQRQIESAINTGANAARAFKPGINVNPSGAGYSGADSFNTGGPIWGPTPR